MGGPPFFLRAAPRRVDAAHPPGQWETDGRDLFLFV